jgi:DNA-binding transcriptional ArsR family regulator
VEQDADDAVFRALSDPHRRALLDALFVEDGQRLGQLCAVLADMTRFGVMKHLAVLAEAGLVVTERQGRTKVHYLNPVPIQRLADRWIAKYARGPVSALTDLAERLEAPRSS